MSQLLHVAAVVLPLLAVTQMRSLRPSALRGAMVSLCLGAAASGLGLLLRRYWPEVNLVSLPLQWALTVLGLWYLWLSKKPIVPKRDA